MDNDILKAAVNATGVKTFEVGGNIYSITLLPASKGLVVGTQLLKVFAPVLGIMADKNTGDDGFTLPDEQTMFYEASTVLVSGMENIDILELVTLLLAGLKFNNEGVVFDTHFRGKYGELLLVLETALKENFGDFLSSYLKAKGLEIPTLRDMMKPKVQPQDESDS